jgi:hypothetical protein
MSESEEALSLVAQVYQAFGLEPLEKPEESELYPYLADGRLVFDAKAEALEYKLAAPLELKNSERVEVVSFREPTASEIEAIRRPLGNDSNLGSLATATIIALVKTGNIPGGTGVADRIKGRDIDALTKIMAELGFFHR